MISVKWGELVTRGYSINIVDMRGQARPIIMVKRGESQDPSCAAVPLAPTRCPKKTKKKKVRVLGMGCGHLASAPW